MKMCFFLYQENDQVGEWCNGNEVHRSITVAGWRGLIPRTVIYQARKQREEYEKEIIASGTSPENFGHFAAAKRIVKKLVPWAAFLKLVTHILQDTELRQNLFYSNKHNRLYDHREHFHGCVRVFVPLPRPAAPNQLPIIYIKFQHDSFGSFVVNKKLISISFFFTTKRRNWYNWTG